MEISNRNLRYLRAEKHALAALLLSGIVLWALLPLGMWELRSPIFRSVWAVHILAQLGSVVLSLRLLLLFVTGIDGRFRWVYPAVILVALAAIIAQGSLPIVSRDALIYHLAVPKFWLTAGHVTELSWHEWSHFPLMLSLGYAGFLDLGLERLTPSYHLSYLVIAAAAAAAFVYYKFQQEELAMFAAVLCLTLPICMKLGAEPMSDLGPACFMGIAYGLFVFWGEQRGSMRMLGVIGLLFGFALCCKYNSLLAMAMFGLCMLSFLQRWGFSLGKSSATIAIIGATALICFSPWPIRNYLATGNPLYPFAGGLFGVSDELPFMGSVKPIEYRLAGYGESWTDVLLIPLRMLVAGQDDNPRQFDGLLSPVLLLALLPLIFRPRPGERRPPWIVSTWIYTGSYLVLSLNLFYALLRYQLPLLVPTAALSTAGLYALSEVSRRVPRETLYRMALAAQLCWSAWYVQNVYRASDTLGYLAGSVTKDEYLESRISEYSVIKRVNADLPKDAVVYLMFTGNRYYYYDRQARGSYFSQTPIVSWLQQKADAAYLAERFHREGITHLAIHKDRTWQSLNASLEDSQKSAWTDFVQNRLEAVYVSNPFSIWKIK